MRLERHSSGFTLIEIIIVIVIIAGVMTAAALGFNATSKSKLGSSAWTLAAASRFAYSHAVTQGVTVRMVLDFNASTIQLQSTRGRVVLNREDESGSGLLREGLDDSLFVDGGPSEDNGSFNSGGGSIFGDSSFSLDGDSSNPLGDMMSGIGMGQITDPFLASLNVDTELGPVAGNPAGYRGPRFTPLEGRRGEPRHLEGGVLYYKVFTPHEPKPREDGKAYVYFFPGGTAEHSIIQLSDGDDEPEIFSVEIHPLTGRAQILSFELEPEQDLDDLQEADE